MLLYEEYVAHKMASTGTYPSTYINTVKEGGLSLPRSCEGGEGTAHPVPPPPPPPRHSYALVLVNIHVLYTVLDMLLLL